MQIPYKMQKPKTVIAAVGSALVDMCLLEDEAFLKTTQAAKGGMTLVDATAIQNILARSKVKPAIVPGGSACNTILGIGKLGAETQFIGKRGKDELGELFESGLIAHNVKPVLFKSDNTPTGHVLSVITPDAQRTMFSYLGASAETDPDSITSELFTNTALVHLEGYLLFNEKLMMSILKAVKKAGAMVSLDLASFTVVEAAKKLIEDICKEYVDIVIANEDEARVFTGSSLESSALDILASKAPLAVLKVGKRGSFIAHGDKRVAIQPMGSGKAIDTTGAGDLWAAGFLYGLMHGMSLENSGRLGSACGYEVCQVVGASIPDDGWKRIRKFI